MIHLLALLAGMHTPQPDKEQALKRANKYIDDICWCWLTSMVLRWAVIAGVAGVVGLVIWRNS